MSILVTGFDRGQYGVNASAVLVGSLLEALPNELAIWRTQLHFAILPLSTRNVWDALAAEVSTCQPRYCVFTGQARGRSRVELERLATNLNDFGSPDVEGLQPCGESIDLSGPAACWSTLPGQDNMVEILNAIGIPAAMSNHAGNHLCNQILYQALYRGQKDESWPSCGFVHILLLPVQTRGQRRGTPTMPLELTRTALTQVLLFLLEREAEGKL